MGDVIFLVGTIAFFVVCVLYVEWCDRIIGSDEFFEAVEEPTPSENETAVAA